MKKFFQYVVNLYRTNSKFHSFVGYVEYTLIGFFVGYSGGIPVTKDAWHGLLVGVAGAIVAAIKRWVVQNVPPPSLPPASS